MAENKIKLLVAEDEESNYFYIERVLRKEFGAENIFHANNGYEAIELFKANSDISIMLIDLKMPVMNGMEALRILKELNNRIPVIAVTAYAMSDYQDMALVAGFDDFLEKPFKPENVISMIYSNIKRYIEK